MFTSAMIETRLLILTTMRKNHQRSLQMAWVKKHDKEDRLSNSISRGALFKNPPFTQLILQQ